MIIRFFFPHHEDGPGHRFNDDEHTNEPSIEFGVEHGDKADKNPAKTIDGRTSNTFVIIFISS